MSYKRERRQYKGKIGYCDNKYLPLAQSVSGGHYVYIRDVRNGLADVHVITSLEDVRSSKPVFNNQKIGKIKRGQVYPIPKRDANFTRWSGIDRTLLRGVVVRHITGVGEKWIRKKHRFGVVK